MNTNFDNNEAKVNLTSNQKKNRFHHKNFVTKLTVKDSERFEIQQ